MGHLEEWLVMDRDYMGSLVGAAEALKGSTLCLPVDCGAMVWLFYSKGFFFQYCVGKTFVILADDKWYQLQVNVQSVKDAICSAVDVMQAMASSICLLLPKVTIFCSLIVFSFGVSCTRIMFRSQPFNGIVKTNKMLSRTLRTYLTVHISCCSQVDIPVALLIH